MISIEYTPTSVRVVANEEIGKGQEVMGNYGNKGNENLPRIAKTTADPGLLIPNTCIIVVA